MAGAALVIAVLAALFPSSWWSPAAATHVDPIFKDGNPTCAELVDSEEELRVQPVVGGTYTDGVLTVVVVVRDTSAGQVFDFTSNIPVEAVFAKGGPNGNLYVYDPAVSADTGLHAPVNPSNGLYFGLSHLSFCYTPVPSTEVNVSASQTVIHSGDEVTFTFTEENDGALPLTNAQVVTSSTECNDALSGPTGDAGTIGTLDVGETWTWTCTFEVTGDPDLDFTLVVVGHGDAPNGDDVTWCADVNNPPADTFCDQQERDEVDIDIINPSTDVDVSATPTTIKPGESVTFTFTEENDGDVPLGTPSLITDSTPCNNALSGPTGDAGTVGVLDPGETWTWTCTITITGTADFTLVATGHGIDPTGDDVTWCADVNNPPAGVFCDQDERESITINVINPNTVLTVSADPTVIESGDSVTFTITEDNAGDVDLTSPSVVTDSADCNAALTGPAGDNGDGILQTTETWSWTCTIPITGAPATTFTLTATGHGFDPTLDDVTWCADVNSPPANVYCDQDERDSITIDIRETFEGLTPGYWKNHLQSWAATGFSPGQTLESVFNVPDGLQLDNVTLLEALSFKGGNGTKGAAQTLLRAAVAALLNSAHPNLNYPRTTASVISAVNAALDSGDRSAMLTLAAALDADNNLGGDINS